MESENAKAVAREVIEKITAGEKVSVGKIAVAHGYAKSMETHPEKIKNTESYQKEIRPFVDKLISNRNRAVQKLNKTIDKATYRDLISAIDTFTKNIQLLSGKETDKVGLTINVESEVAEKYELNSDTINSSQGQPQI